MTVVWNFHIATLFARVKSPYQAKLAPTRANLRPGEVADGDFDWVHNNHGSVK